VKTYDYRFDVNGIELTSAVSPCVWMYPNYPLQISVQFKGGGVAYLKNPHKTWSTTTEQDVIDLASTVKLQPCSRCSKPAYDPATVETNRGGLCESCFMSDLDAKFQKLVKQEETAVRRRDRSMRKKGYTHRVSGWVHPAMGDDVKMDWYFDGLPSKAQIEKALREAGSQVLNDYQEPIEI